MPLAKMVIVPFERYKRLMDSDEGGKDNTGKIEAPFQTLTHKQTGEGIKEKKEKRDETAHVASDGGLQTSQTSRDLTHPPPPPGDPAASHSEEQTDKEKTGSEKSWLDIWIPLPPPKL